MLTWPSLRMKGFTLAEVLITVVVIGIIAAITIPSLLYNFEKKKNAAHVKKAYAELLAAIRLSEIENGPISGWDFQEGADPDKTREFVEEYIRPYYYLKYCGMGHDGEYCGQNISVNNSANYMNASGTGISITTSYKAMFVIITTNLKANKDDLLLGRTHFYFSTMNPEGILLPYAFEKGLTRDMIKQGYVPSVNGNDARVVTCKKVREDEDENELLRHGCTALLMLDGWEFKSDYPY